MKRLNFIVLTVIMLVSFTLVPLSTLAAVPNSDYVIDFSNQTFVNSLPTPTRSMIMYDSTELSSGSLNMIATANDPYVNIAANNLFNGVGINGNGYQWVAFNIKNPSNADYFEFYFIVDGGAIGTGQCVQVPIEKNSGSWKTYIAHIPTANITAAARINKITSCRESVWTRGTVTTIRLDAMFSDGGIVAGDEMFIEHMSFYPTKAAAQSAVSGATVAVDSNMPNLTPAIYPAAILDFTKEETQSYLNTKSNLEYSYDTTISSTGSMKWQATATDCRAYVDTTIFSNIPVRFDQYKWIAVTIYNSSPADTFEMYLTSTSAPEAVATKHRIISPIEPNKAEWKTYVINVQEGNIAGGALTESVLKDGYLLQMRIDALLSSNTAAPIKSGDTMYIKSVGLYASEDQAYGRVPVVTTSANTTVKPGVTTTPPTFDAFAVIVSGAVLSLSSFSYIKRKRSSK